MALPAQALVSLEEFKDHIGLNIERHANDTRFEEVIGYASGTIGRKLGRTLVFQGTDYTEFHSFERRASFFYTRQWPIIAVTTLNEDTARVFPSADDYSEGTEFLVHKERGKVIRISEGGAFPISFEAGIDLVKLVYSAGFALDADIETRMLVPDRFKIWCLRIGARMWREIDRREQGVSSKSDQLGNVTKFSDSMIPSDVAEEMHVEMRAPGFMSTGRAA